MESKSVRHIQEYVNNEFANSSLPLLNGHVYYIYNSIAKPTNSKTIQQLMTSYKFSDHSRTLCNAIQSLIMDMKFFRKNPTRSWKELIEYLHSTFKHQPLANGLSAEEQERTNALHSDVNNKIREKKRNMKRLKIKKNCLDNRQTVVTRRQHNLKNKPADEGADETELSLPLNGNQICIVCERKQLLINDLREKCRIKKFNNKQFKKQDKRNRESTKLWKTKYKLLKFKKPEKNTWEIRREHKKKIKGLLISVTQLKRFGAINTTKYISETDSKNEQISKMKIELEKLKDKINELIQENHSLICLSLGNPVEQHEL